MNSDPLANLKPLIAPPPISWWPLAPGWWVLAALILLLLIVLTIFIWRRLQHHRNTAYQREALQLIALTHTMPTQQQLPLLAEILRRAAICVWGRETVGSINWIEMMQHTQNSYKQRHPKKTWQPILDEQSCELLNHHLYSGATPDTAAMHKLIEQAQKWLTSLPPVGR
ncbi:MAG: DUF4381 domain-containing protein [Pseudomonadales bacterium]